MRTQFRDRQDRLAYLKACEVARRMRKDPSLVEEGRRWLERFMAPDPHQAAYVALWREVLRHPAAEIAALLEEDSERAQLLRETAPVFSALLPADAHRLVQASHGAC